MGQNQTIRSHVQRQYNAVKKSDKRDYLVIEEAKKLQSLDEYPIDFKKLAVLFMLDFDKNGKFSLDDLMKFTDWCGTVTEHLKTDQQSFKSELQAQCTLHMWKQINTARNGKKVFGDWFVRVFSVGHIVKCPKYPKTHWVSIDTASIIHELLSIKELYGISCQQFMNLMQTVGEEKGLMSLDDVDLDDVIPTDVIHDFAVSFITGFLNMMSSLGFSPEKYLTTAVAVMDSTKPVLESTNNNNVISNSKTPTEEISSTLASSMNNTSVNSSSMPPLKLGIPKLNIGISQTTMPVVNTTKASENDDSYSSEDDDSEDLESSSNTNNVSQPPVPSLSLKLLPIPALSLQSNPSVVNNATSQQQSSSKSESNSSTLPFTKLALPKINASPTIEPPQDPNIINKSPPNLNISTPSNTFTTLSPNASAFLLNEQNNLEKIEESGLSDEELSESAESDNSDDDDSDIASPRKAPQVHPLLLQVSNVSAESNKPKIPTLSIKKEPSASSAQPSSDEVSVNGISMKKLKF
ncbi:hypothetical protein FDP41_009066 [Naegleria fowleri]|uniref:EF-hand domain-containing protein n=1 Tax=Naegleria fowleri TaxID=5763 RepID=A0A6A5B495_NAEFO|nr:uncharacterized protein FDP41_009066 [Naegleria fowleri]KAF0972817.1 hypothetical protein FDP41_009066 [Naegleria fowleri]CAG4718738.1 unnamed protein product [Naegleria fowleri]